MPSLPNFLIIGAAKSGTTALYEYLKQHPQIFMSVIKEPKFFAHENRLPNWKGPGDERYDPTTITNIALYLAMFHEVTDEKAVGEASTQYLYMPGAAERIKYYVPNAKLIAILRNPVEVSYSAFLHKRREGFEPLSDFGEALRQEPVRIKDNWSPLWHYRQRGFYHEHLKHYYELFDRDRIRVYLYDDLKKDPAGLIKSIFQFLEVDPSFDPSMAQKPNQSGIPKSPKLHKFLSEKNNVRDAVRRFLPHGTYWRAHSSLQEWNLEKPRIPLAQRAQLVEDYRDEVTKLESFLGRDLSHWLKVSS
jgi:hypothetical protein